MSLHPHVIAPVPEETARVARAAFPKGHPYLTFRDALGTIFQDEDFAALFPAWGQPGLPPWRLALVTIMQFRENLADRQAAEAVRARIDWKYLLSLELTDPGFDFSVLSEFRDRLLAGSAEELLLEKLLERCRALGLLTARGQQRTDSTHVLAAIRVLNRLELVAETLRAALNAVATVAPDWLQAVTPLAWYERYSRRIEESRLPKDKAEREAYAQTVGEDGFQFLDALDTPGAPEGLRELPRIEALRRTWQRHYERTARAPASPGASPALGCVSRRAVNCHRPPRASNRPTMSRRATATNATRSGPATWCTSAKRASPPPRTCSRTSTRPRPRSMRRSARRPSSRRSSTRTCPRRSTSSMRPISARSCSSRAATTRASSLRGPPARVRAGRAQVEGAYTIDQFAVDWDQQQVRCPQGKHRRSWAEHVAPQGSPYIHVVSARRTAGRVPQRACCTTQASRRPAPLRLPPQDQYEALTAAQAWYASEEGQQPISSRAGVEGTLSQGVRAFGLRRTRYWGLAKTHLQHVATAAAINIDRIVAWLDERPRAQTRTSRFAALAPADALKPGEAAA